MPDAFASSTEQTTEQRDEPMQLVSELTEDSYTVRVWVDNEPIDLPMRAWVGKHYDKGDNTNETAKKLALTLGGLAPVKFKQLVLCIMADDINTAIGGWIIYPEDL